MHGQKVQASICDEDEPSANQNVRGGFVRRASFLEFAHRSRSCRRGIGRLSLVGNFKPIRHHRRRLHSGALLHRQPKSFRLHHRCAGDRQSVVKPAIPSPLSIHAITRRRLTQAEAQLDSGPRGIPNIDAQIAGQEAQIAQAEAQIKDAEAALKFARRAKQPGAETS